MFGVLDMLQNTFGIDQTPLIGIDGMGKNLECLKPLHSTLYLLE